jgi:hypothetical protein
VFFNNGLFSELVSNEQHWQTAVRTAVYMFSTYFFEYVCAFHIIIFHDCFYFVPVDTVVNITTMALIFNNFQLPAGNIGYP